MKKTAACFLFLAVLALMIYADVSGNRRMASRYLSLAVNAFSTGDYDAAEALVETGMSYDSSVPDFWYIKALEAQNRGGSRRELTEYLEKAVSCSDWVIYNGFNAKLMLARIYYEEGNYSGCQKLMTGSSGSGNAEACWLEASSLYELGRAKEAAEVIRYASSVFPDDGSFLELFFRKEYERSSKDGLDVPYKDLAGKGLTERFLKRIITDYEYNPDMLIYASFFAEADEGDILLSVYKACQPEESWNPFFIYASLKNGKGSEEELLNQYAELCGGVYTLDLLSMVAGEVKTLAGINRLNDMLSSFTGTLLVSLSNDDVYQLSCRYEYGMPAEVLYDGDADGITDWSVECTMGVPGNFISGDLSILYGSFPYVSHAYFNETGTSYSFVPYTETWSILEMQEHDIGLYGCTLPLPVLKEESPSYSEESALYNAWQIDMPAYGHDGDRIVFTVFEGSAVEAMYMQNDEELATGFFQNGMLQTRLVDMDGDGDKEVTESYVNVPFPDGSTEGLDESFSVNIPLRESLFAGFPYPYDIRLSELSIDTDGDNVDDYRELYGTDGSIRQMWGCRGDGSYDSAIMVSGDGRTEVSEFAYPLEDRMVSVTSYDGIPVSVKEGDLEYAMIHDQENDFYWIDSVPESDSMTPAVKAELDALSDGMYAIITYEENGIMVLARKAAGIYMGAIVEDNLQ